jgi:hypothetical protein
MDPYQPLLMHNLFLYDVLVNVGLLLHDEASTSCNHIAMFGKDFISALDHYCSAFHLVLCESTSGFSVKL